MLIASWLQGLTRKLKHLPRASRRRRSFSSHGVQIAQVEVLESRVLLTMQSPVTVAAGTVATAVAVGDFNGDGIKDVAQLNSSTSTVTVLMGNGDGSFQPGVTSAAGGTGTKMTVADFNHDGKLDIVTNQGFSLDLLKGNGDGTFQLPVAYNVGAFANDVEAGDFNNDGFVDLVTASFSYGGTTQLLLNDGTGSFLPSRNLAIGPSGFQVEVGDVNGDGNLDLVQSSGNGYVGIMMGHGDGTFASIAAANLGMATQDIQVGDLNRDGKADVVVTSGSQIKVFDGNGAATFQNFTSYQVAGASRLQLADINEDGNVDIVANNGMAILGRGIGGFYAPTNYGTAAGTELALGDLNGDGAIDAVAVTNSLLAGGGASVTLNANNDVQLLAGATQLLISASGPATAGSPFAVTVTALDANGNVATGFQGTVGVSGAPGTQPVSYTFSASDGGVHTIANAATLFTAGSGTFSVTSPFLPDASGTMNVVAAGAAKFTVAAQASSVAGDAASVTVSALDAYGNFAGSYAGTVHFTSTDVQAGLPTDYTFTGADAGVHTFTVTLKTAGSQTVTASDLSSSTFIGVSGAINVTPAAAASLSLTGGGGYIGSVNAVTITARDAYGNVATGYNGIVHLASSDAASATSADAVLANGVGTFTVTPMTLGTQTLTASDVADATIGGSEVINVTPSWGARFVATPLSATVAGQTQTTTVTVYDAFGDISTVYTGWVAVATTDPRAPLNYVYFSAADAGVKTIGVTLYTAGSQAVTISDYANSAVTVTQTGITVTPAAAASVSVTPLQSTTAGVAQSFTVSMLDAYGNVATNYRGTLNFTSSDALATLPAAYTFTAADAGTHTFSMTFKSSGGQSITVADAANPLGLTYFQRDTLITPAALSSFGFKGASLSNTTAGAVFSLTVSATDAFGNTITGYTGTVLFTSTDAQITLPTSYTFTATDAGAHTFSVALKTAGTQSITATDSVNGAITGTQTAIVVKAAAASSISIAAQTAATSGVAQSITVTAMDAYGNVSTGYTGTVKFSSSDGLAVLPANYSFTNKDAGVRVFTVTLKTPGSQSITVADTVNSALTGAQAGIMVSAATAPVASFSVAGFPATTAGTAKTFTVTAKDALGNIVTGYTGTVTFSSSDVKAGLPASYTFTAADAGVHTFSATLKTAGTQSITVKDAAAGAVIGSQTGISVTAGGAVQFVMSTPMSVTQGVGFKFTLTAYDAYGNVATGYRGTVHISSTDTKSGTSNYTFSSNDKGVATFSYTFNTLGSQTLTVADTTNSSLISKNTVNVLAK